MATRAKEQSRDDGYRLPDHVWERIAPLLPQSKPHPLGCHRPRVPDRAAMDAILLVLRTGMQWKALDVGGPCKGSVAHKRFQEWTQAGVFQKLWQEGLRLYDEQVGIDWEWLAMDVFDNMVWPHVYHQNWPHLGTGASMTVLRQSVVEGSTRCWKSWDP